MATINTFNEELMYSLHRINPMSTTASLCEQLGLRPGIDTSLHIYTFNGEDAYVHIEVNYKQITSTARQALKRMVDMQIPDWALGGTYKEPPLEGQLRFHKNPAHPYEGYLNINFAVNGAYVCEKVGEQERDPSEYEKREADRLANMTAEEILAEHAKRVEEAKAPRKVASYRCKPADVTGSES